jgi:hypothetical protein
MKIFSITRHTLALVLGLAIATSALAKEAHALNTKDFAGTYSVGIPAVNGIYYGTGSFVTLKVTANGKMSATWATSPDGLTATGSAKMTGTISKVTKGTFSSKAKFTFTTTDKSKGSGTIEFFAAAKSAALTGSITNGGKKQTIAGSRTGS